ncbi:MAG: hypothetical protein WC532_02080 [Candidatus Omnitrophota bacterium]
MISNAIRPKFEFFLDLIGFYAIGFFALLYILFTRNFAEIKYDAHFFGFPIFIGEFLLFFCLGLLAVKWAAYGFKYSRISYLFLPYFIFVLVKVVMGYGKWGPLTLRDSAMFYYPVFAVFTYVFYRNSLMSIPALVLSAVALIFLHFFNASYVFSDFIFFLLATVVIFKIPQRAILKAVLAAALFLFSPYKLFFAASRTMLVGNLAAIIFLVIAFFCCLNVKLRLKIAFLIPFFLCLVSLLIIFSPRNELKSLVSFRDLKDNYDETIKLINDMEPGFKAEEIPPRLYNPENNKRIDTLRHTEMAANDINPPLVYMPQQSLLKMPRAVTRAQGTINGAPMVLTPTGSAPAVLAPVPWNNPSFLSDSKQRSLESAINTTLFRVFIWKDMLSEIYREKKYWFGFNFGKPLRSKSIEILQWAVKDWRHDGWITPHNSYLSLIYRSGAVGLLYIIALMITLAIMIKRSIRSRSFAGILACAILIDLLVTANFTLMLELPYNAIPFWALFGTTLAYIRK